MSDRVEWPQDDAQESSPSGPIGFDLWGLLMRRKWLLVFGVAIGVGLGYLYFLRQPPIYQAAAQILITKRTPPSAIPTQPFSVYDEYEPTMSTHSLVIRSPLIVNQAVHDPELAPLVAKHGTALAASIVAQGLTVSPADRDANVLDVAYRGSDGDECAKIVNSVVRAYTKFLEDTQVNIGRETVDLIEKGRKDLLAQLEVKEKNYLEFRERATLIWKEGAGTNIHRERLTQIEQSRSEIMLNRSQTKARLRAIETALANGVSREALTMMAGESVRQQAKPLVADPERDGLRDVFTLMLQEQEYLEKYGPDHPQVQSIRKRIEMTRDFLKNLEPADPTETAKVGEPDFLTTYVDSLRQELSALEEQERELGELFVSEQNEAKSLVADEVKDSTLRSDIARTQQLFEAVVKRLEEINLVKDYGVYTMQTLAWADQGYQVAPSLSRTMTIAALLGLAGGFGLAWFVDVANRTFYSPAEVSQLLRLPLVGHIPRIDRKTKRSAPKGSKLDPILCTVHRPKSPLAEAYRAVRTALYFNSRGQAHRVIQVTSPVPGDGKSTLAANLAVSIAQSGKKVLLLDADFRRPRLHKMLGKPADGLGLASVIAGTAQPQDAIQSTEVENLFLMTCGDRPSNPSELLTSPKFKELLDSLRQQFEFVLIDTPPLLAVTDPSVVAARVDGVLLTMRIKKNSRVSAQRAADMLSSLGAKVFGVVVNGVGERSGYGYGPARGGSGRYGHPSYGYGYGYGEGGKAYGYGSYYADDEQKERSRNGHPEKSLS